MSDQRNEDEARHAGSGENDLEDALDSLPAGQRVFITYDDYAEHYSPSGEHWNKFDHEGMSPVTMWFPVAPARPFLWRRGFFVCRGCL